MNEEKLLISVAQRLNTMASGELRGMSCGVFASTFHAHEAAYCVSGAEAKPGGVVCQTSPESAS
jgi:hypothetical protein